MLNPVSLVSLRPLCRAVEADASPECRILESPPFPFLIGVDKKKFTLHAALVAHHSRPLGAMLHGPMLEAKEQCAWLQDVDRDTFIRFGQYIYTGDYKPADMTVLFGARMIGDVPAKDDASIEDPDSADDTTPAKDKSKKAVVYHTSKKEDKERQLL